MPKYVPKEDVEKGLVDPTKPLDEQLEYKKKIEQEHEQKEKVLGHKAKDNDTKQHRQRPKKERPPRNQRPVFNWNKNEITLETKAPEKPKKLLEKPDAQKHKEGFEKLKAERQALKAQRSAILDEQRAIIRDINESKKYGRELNTQYSGPVKQKMEVERQLRKQIKSLDDQKVRIFAEIENLKAKVEDLRKPGKANGLSIETIQNRIAEKEHRLTTSDIDKNGQSRLTSEINELKRALNNARSSIEIQSDIKKLTDQIQILYDESKPIRNQLKIKINQANAIKEERLNLQEQKKSEQKDIPVHRSIEEIKAEYEAKLKALEQKRDKLEDKIDDYLDRHTRQIDDYEDQQDLLKYIQWVEDQIGLLKKKQEDEVRKQKEKEEREKKRQKEKEQYEQRQEERKKREEQRKKKDEEYKAKLEKEKEDFINRNPNHQTIDLCHTLIDYCQSLRPNPVFEYEQNRNKPRGQIKFGKEWQKQIKGGAQIIVSKKHQEDEKVEKKPVKEKKKEKPEQQAFEHGIEVVNQFQFIKLLPPLNSNEIDSTIKLIRDKIEFYNNPTEEEKAAYREKSIKVWEEKQAARQQRRQDRGGVNAFREKREDVAVADEPRKEKKEHHRKPKKEILEGDFPELA